MSGLSRVVRISVPVRVRADNAKVFRQAVAMAKREMFVGAFGATEAGCYSYETLQRGRKVAE